MINLYVLFLILITHYIADFLCQTREMGTKKSKSVFWLTMHVLVYTTVTTISWLLFSINLQTLIIVWLVTFISHWLTDFITSKMTTHFFEKTQMFNFWSTIGFDQLVHCLTLISTYNFLIKTL